MGAWIEINKSFTEHGIVIGSHPVWVRGLKLLLVVRLVFGLLVAPRVGAWIEIIVASAMIILQAPSHPVWVRGLKC